MTIVIDPYMFSIPSGPNVDTGVVLDYATRLMGWEKEFTSATDKYVVSSWAMDAAYHLDLAPTVQNLRTLFARYGVDEFYSATDVAPTCEGVIVNSPQMEERAGVNCELMSEIECISGTEVVIPDEIRERIHPDIAAAFIKALIFAGYALETNQATDKWSLATVPFKVAKTTSTLKIEASIEHVNGSKLKSLREWSLLFDPEHLYAGYNILDYFRVDPWLATRIAWCRMKKDGVPVKGIDVPAICFGSRFIESLERPQIKRRPAYERDIDRVFEAIVYVMEDLWAFPSDKHHPLRESIRDRTSPQQNRRRQDKQGSWYVERAGRIEIIAGANCLHLHYWQCFGGKYEFSNVTDVHDDPTIYR